MGGTRRRGIEVRHRASSGWRGSQVCNSPYGAHRSPNIVLVAPPNSSPDVLNTLPTALVYAAGAAKEGELR